MSRISASTIRDGDPEPARTLVDDTVLERVMLAGQPSVVGRRLAELVREHRPTSIGLALVQDDLNQGVCDAAEAFTAMNAELEGDRELEGNCELGGNCELEGNCELGGNCELEGNCELGGNCELEGNCELGGDRWPV